MRIKLYSCCPQGISRIWIVFRETGFTSDIFGYFQLFEGRAGPSADAYPVFAAFLRDPSFRTGSAIAFSKIEAFERENPPPISQ
jgi:hypothetical protein